jgi:hypothetical protein
LNPRVTRRAKGLTIARLDEQVARKITLANSHRASGRVIHTEPATTK